MVNLCVCAVSYRVPKRITAAPRTIVAPSHLGDAHRLCQSLGSMGDIRVGDGELAHQHSGDNPSRVMQPRYCGSCRR